MTTGTTAPAANNDPAAARRRRKEIIQAQRSMEDAAGEAGGRKKRGNVTHFQPGSLLAPKLTKVLAETVANNAQQPPVAIATVAKQAGPPPPAAVLQPIQPKAPSAPAVAPPVGSVMVAGSAPVQEAAVATAQPVIEPCTRPITVPIAVAQPAAPQVAAAPTTTAVTTTPVLATAGACGVASLPAGAAAAAHAAQAMPASHSVGYANVGAKVGATAASTGAQAGVQMQPHVHVHASAATNAAIAAPPTANARGDVATAKTDESRPPKKRKIVNAPEMNDEAPEPVAAAVATAAVVTEIATTAEAALDMEMVPGVGGDEGFAVGPGAAAGVASRTGPKKTQVRYDPDVPMNKEQLAAWRREARRVRNRESAAASRQRIRDRISELQDEADGWKLKYIQAMQRLQALERAVGQADDGTTNACQPTGLI